MDRRTDIIAMAKTR